MGSPYLANQLSTTHPRSRSCVKMPETIGFVQAHRHEDHIRLGLRPRYQASSSGFATAPGFILAATAAGVFPFGLGGQAIVVPVNG